MVWHFNLEPSSSLGDKVFASKQFQAVEHYIGCCECTKQHGCQMRVLSVLQGTYDQTTAQTSQVAMVCTIETLSLPLSQS